MAKSQLVTRSNLSTTDFNFDSSAKKIRINFPTNTGVRDAQLSGSNLQLTLQDNSVKSVPLASLIPAAKADVFLKSVERSGSNLVFKTGNAQNTNDDNTITVAISDLIETAVGNGLSGKGTTAEPIALKLAQNSGLAADTNGVKIDKANFKPIATVQLVDAFDEEIGYAFTESERSAS